MTQISLNSWEATQDQKVSLIEYTGHKSYNPLGTFSNTKKLLGRSIIDTPQHLGSSMLC